jgi:hypothetical protein
MLSFSKPEFFLYFTYLKKALFNNKDLILSLKLFFLELAKLSLKILMSSSSLLALNCFIKLITKS